MGWINFCLALFAPVGIGVETVITQCDLSFIRNMGGYSSNEFKVIHPLLFSSEFSVLVRYLTLGLIKGKFLEGEYGFYHVLANTLSLCPGPCANPTVYIEAGVAPPQDLLHKREVYKLVMKKQRENLPGKNPCEQRIIEI